MKQFIKFITSFFFSSPRNKYNIPTSLIGNDVLKFITSIYQEGLHVLGDFAALKQDRMTKKHKTILEISIVLLVLLVCWLLICHAFLSSWNISIFSFEVNVWLILPFALGVLSAVFSSFALIVYLVQRRKRHETVWESFDEKSEYNPTTTVYNSLLLTLCEYNCKPTDFRRAADIVLPLFILLFGNIYIGVLFLIGHVTNFLTMKIYSKDIIESMNEFYERMKSSGVTSDSYLKEGSIVNDLGFASEENLMLNI